MTMEPAALGAIAREAILVSLILSAPLVGAAAVVGLVLGLLQALTQLQDQTTAFALKLLVVMGLVLVLMPWLGAMAFGYADRAFTMIFELR